MLVSFVVLAKAILAHRARLGVVRLVAVDGSGGAGKSVFAKRLAAALGGAPIVATDDFASWENPTDWWPRLEAKVLEPLARGETARFQAYDWVARRFRAWHDVLPSDVVILEGVTSARSAVADRQAYSIWIDTRPSRRLERGLERDGEAMRGQWEDWMASEDRFFHADPVRERADLIVDGDPSLAHDPETDFVRLR
jgi:uridine kinase